MKKRTLSLFLILLLSFFIFGCKDNEETTPTESETPIETIDEREDVNHIGGLKYKLSSNWEHNGGYEYAGLYEKDGTKHEGLEENQTTGKTINVTYFGAISDDPNYDNTGAVKAAIDSAKAGDEVYFPAGKWYFKTQTLASPVYSHITLKSGVNLRGEGSDKTSLVSCFVAAYNNGYPTAVIAAVASSNITISDITVTALVTEEMMPPTLSTTTANFPGRDTAPQHGIYVCNNDLEEKAENVVIKNCLIEFFQVSGITLRSTIDCKVYNCTLQKATDLSGGGHGYAICVEGNGNESFYNVGGNLDSRYNVIENNQLIGPYLRHAIILSYVTHNNLVYNNTITGSQDEALDVHGEDEFLNVFSSNKVTNCASNCFGAGNGGSTHDASGPANVVYNNDFSLSKGGIAIVYGTPETIIIKNNIYDLSDDGIAININYGPGTLVNENTISNINGESFGVRVSYNYVWSNPSDGLSKVTITKNNIKNVKTALYLQAYKDGSSFDGNIVTECEVEKVDLNSEFVMPEASDYFTQRVGVSYFPVQEGNINRGSWNDVVANLGYFWFKGSDAEPAFNRMIFYEWELDLGRVSEASHVYIRLTFTSKSARQHFFFWGIENLEWDNKTMTWSNAPFVNNLVNNKDLKEDPTGQYPVEEYPYAAKIYDPENKLTKIADYESISASEEFLTYYFDITEYVKALKSSNFTMILSNETMDGAYSSVRNMLNNPEELWPSIILTND